jgi:O-acetyl-ADP-ribose deacetylase (regulator of RNase III)
MSKRAGDDDEIPEGKRPRLEEIDIVREIRGDLFTAPSPTSSLAHCVSADMAMGKGIAVHFKKKFGRVDELKAQKVPVGRCAVLANINGSYVFYLITKERYFQKPTMRSMRSALEHLAQLCTKFKIQELAMPRIGCGLDGLEWSAVKQEIEHAFQSGETKVTICSV